VSRSNEVGDDYKEVYCYECKNCHVYSLIGAPSPDGLTGGRRGLR